MKHDHLQFLNDKDEIIATWWGQLDLNPHSMGYEKTMNLTDLAVHTPGRVHSLFLAWGDLRLCPIRWAAELTLPVSPGNTGTMSVCLTAVDALTAENAALMQDLGPFDFRIYDGRPDDHAGLVQDMRDFARQALNAPTGYSETVSSWGPPDTERLRNVVEQIRAAEPTEQIRPSTEPAAPARWRPAAQDWYTSASGNAPARRVGAVPGRAEAYSISASYGNYAATPTPLSARIRMSGQEWNAAMAALRAASTSRD